MREVFRTSDPIEIAFIKSLFDGANIPYFIFGDDMASNLGTMLGNIYYCQIKVHEDDYADACTLLRQGELEVYDDGE